jgi:PAS domain S-box-containing protein
VDTFFLNEQRCKCGKLLLKAFFFDGVLEIKCKKCGVVNKIGGTKLIDDKNNYHLIINEKGLITNVSNSISEILGYTREELVNQHFTKINKTVPSQIKDIFFRTRLMLNEDNYFQLDTVHETKEGKKIPVIVFIKLYQPTEKERFLLVSVKLNNNENNDYILNRDASEYLKKTCDFYFHLDKNGIINYISPSVKNIFGFSQEAAISKNYFECIAIGNRDESKKLFEFFSKIEKPYRTEDIVCLSTNGKTLHTELFFTPDYNNMGKFIGYRVLVWAKEKL